MKSIILFLSVLCLTTCYGLSIGTDSPDEAEVAACAALPNTRYIFQQSSTRPTCDNPNPRGLTKDLRSYCGCQDGYVADDNKGCILEKDCPQRIAECNNKDANSEYNACHSSTKNTCQNPDNGISTDDCQEGCVCKQGYLLDEQAEKCVDKCPEN